ncbi:YccF domain-containing protein [Kitasatospora sp. NPDC059463]|uniref:YccF domain-containing protein n=1 Tax=unclassified Kitasatospora TaxID=2633591 RepID=UPI0036BAE098
MKVIGFVLNVLWLVFCGFWMAIGYVIAGIICCILIITIPFGIASFRLAGFVIWPFGRTAVERPDAGAPSCIGNVIWLIFAGWWLALMHLVTSIPLFLSIIGIPFGWANLKLIPVSLMPLGREIVSTDEPWGGRR